MSTPGVKKTLQFNNGVEIPVLGFGTWQAETGVVARALETAIKSGFRHIDCATIYNNQEELGGAFEKVFAEKIVERKDLFITTKLWNTDHDPKHVEESCRLSLKELKLDYIDLYLIHWPVAWKRPENGYSNFGERFPRNEEGGSHTVPVTLAETWAAMEKLVELGLVKSIGVSNVSTEQLVELKKTWKIAPVTNQIEVQPFCPNTDLKKAQKELAGIEVTAYCPLGVGMGKDDGAISNAVFNHPTIKAIAEEAGVSSATLCIQWSLQKGNIVLSKSTTDSRIAENAAISADGLSTDIIAKVDALFESGNKDYRRRVCNPDFFNEKAGSFFPLE